MVSREVFCAFEVPGEPQAWSRAGAAIRRRKDGQAYIHWYTRDEDAAYRDAIAWAAKAAMRGRKPTWRPTAILVHAFMTIPESWHWKHKQAARAGAILPVTTPDFDNLAKVAADAIRGIVWTDDASVVDGRVIKRYSECPALRVEVREFVSP